MTLHPAIAHIPRPPRIARLPLDAQGYPQPWFVGQGAGGLDPAPRTPRVIAHATKRHLCWICGERLNQALAFLLETRATLTHMVSEPPSHPTCAGYAVQTCPFLTRPATLDHQRWPFPRQPRVTCLWRTRSYKAFLAQARQRGMGFEVGSADHVQWWCEGRAATLDEVAASLAAALALLSEEAGVEGQRAQDALHARLVETAQFLPEAQRRSV